MQRTKLFRFLSFMTALPLPLLGIMLIFGVMGKIFEVGWLSSAPDVLLIPTLLTYYISLLLGAIYGFLKKEESVYLMAFIGIAVWILGLILDRFLTLSREIMIGVTVFFLAVLLVLHILQYRATKKWEERLTPVPK